MSFCVRFALFAVINLYDSEDTQTTKDYYREFMTCFSRDEAAGETRIQDPLQLLNLLLSQNELVFRWLMDIKNTQEQQGAGPPSVGPDGKPEVRKKPTVYLLPVLLFFVIWMEGSRRRREGTRMESRID